MIYSLSFCRDLRRDMARATEIPIEIPSAPVMGKRKRIEWMLMITPF